MPASPTIRVPTGQITGSFVLGGRTVAAPLPAFAALCTYSSALVAVASKAPVALASTDVDDQGMPCLPSPFNASDHTTGRAMFHFRELLRKVFNFVVTDADNETVNARVWDWLLWRVASGSYYLVPRPVCDLVITAGSNACPWVTNGFFADTIAVTNVTRPASLLAESYSRIGNDVATLEVPPCGAPVLEIECTLNGATGAGLQIFAHDR